MNDPVRPGRGHLALSGGLPLEPLYTGIAEEPNTPARIGQWYRNWWQKRSQRICNTPSSWKPSNSPALTPTLAQIYKHKGCIQGSARSALEPSAPGWERGVDSRAVVKQAMSTLLTLHIGLENAKHVRLSQQLGTRKQSTAGIYGQVAAECWEQRGQFWLAAAWHVGILWLTFWVKESAFPAGSWAHLRTPPRSFHASV